MESSRDMMQVSREYRPALMAFFLRRVHDHAEAEDLTQEAFARLASLAETQLQSGSAYLFQIAANLLRDRRRRQQIRADYRATIGEIEAANVDMLDPFRVVAARHSIATMRAALSKLSEETEAIFVLYRLENMSKAAIAESFGMSIRMVERHITRAMAYLAERFGDEL